MFLSINAKTTRMHMYSLDNNTKPTCYQSMEKLSAGFTYLNLCDKNEGVVKILQVSSFGSEINGPNTAHKREKNYLHQFILK